MFQQIKAMLGVDGGITLSIRASGDTLKIFLCPTQSTDKKTDPSLLQPLTLSATAEELDAGFVDALAKYSGSRKSLGEQVEATALIIGEAEKAAKEKAATKSKVATPKKVDVALKDTQTLGSNDDDDDDSDGKGDDDSADSTAGVTIPATATKSEKQTEADPFANLF